MNRDETARALLRLYPAAWRERYGDELLALIDESGLTFRIVLDVVLAAAVERVRSAAWLLRNGRIAGELPPPSEITLRYILADFLPRAAILCGTIVGLHFAGVAYPPWSTWLVLFLRCEDTEFMAPRHKSQVARLFVWSYWLFLAVVLAALSGLVASVLRRVGIPEPSTGVFYGILGTVLVVGFIRAIPIRYKAMSFNSTWPGLNPREIRFWQAVWFGVSVLFFMVEELSRLLWPSAIILWIALQPPHGLTREGIAQQRAFKEERDRQSPWGRLE